jgi:hypothetical protein
MHGIPPPPPLKNPPPRRAVDKDGSYWYSLTVLSFRKKKKKHYSKKTTARRRRTGKALARSGELLIDLTSSLDMYGGSLSAAGASIRNCGDCVAQAAASCRFKTAAELVIDELREGESPRPCVRFPIYFASDRPERGRRGGDVCRVRKELTLSTLPSPRVSAWKTLDPSQGRIACARAGPS